MKAPTVRNRSGNKWGKSVDYFQTAMVALGRTVRLGRSRPYQAAFAVAIPGRIRGRQIKPLSRWPNQAAFAVAISSRFRGRHTRPLSRWPYQAAFAVAKVA